MDISTELTGPQRSPNRTESGPLAGASTFNHSTLRKQRFRACLPDAVATPRDVVDDERLWVSFVASRLGHDASHHEVIARYLSRAMLECQRNNHVALVAGGSSIEKWAIRSAELFRVPLVRLHIQSDDALSSTAVPSDATLLTELSIESGNPETIQRDRVAIMLGDRVNALSVRRGGTVERWIRERVSQVDDIAVRVAVTGFSGDASLPLIAHGAIGWYLSERHEDTDVFSERHTPRSDNPSLSTEQTSDQETNTTLDSSPPLLSPARWMNEQDEWLVHCTRGIDGPWPGETENEYRDSLLLGGARSNHSACETLERIVRSGRLLAGHRTSSKRWPVVCFSSVSLGELLARRCYRAHVHRWDYEPYGIAIRRSSASKRGIQPVIYGDRDVRDNLPLADRYRFQSAGKTYDWTAEREWRSCGDVNLFAFEPHDIRVFTATIEEARKLSALSPWTVDVATRGD